MCAGNWLSPSAVDWVTDQFKTGQWRFWKANNGLHKNTKAAATNDPAKAFEPMGAALGRLDADLYSGLKTALECS
jgi:hypothetical protein